MDGMGILNRAKKVKKNRRFFEKSAVLWGEFAKSLSSKCVAPQWNSNKQRFVFPILFAENCLKCAVGYINLGNDIPQSLPINDVLKYFISIVAPFFSCFHIFYQDLGN